MIYEAQPYIMLWYDQDLEAYNNNTFTGYLPQPAPEGVLLNNYTFANLAPVSDEAGANTADSGGIPVGVWIGIVAAIAVLALIAVALRRRVGVEDRA